MNYISLIPGRLLIFGRMIKFSHTVFALPFALSAVILAMRGHSITIDTVFWIILAMASARSSAMGFNRLVDAGFDGLNPRTRNREIPSGMITAHSAALFVFFSSLVFVFSALMLGRLCFYLSFPTLGLLLFYSFTKRFTWFCHIYLGFVISMAPMGAWIAVTGAFSLKICLLSLALMTHISGFDIIYACQDIDFDKRNNLFSIPAIMGTAKALKISSWLHALSFSALFLIMPVFGLGRFYLLAVLVIGVLFIAEHLLVKPTNLDKINIAFFHINSVISIILLAGIIADFLFLGMT